MLETFLRLSQKKRAGSLTVYSVNNAGSLNSALLLAYVS